MTNIIFINDEKLTLRLKDGITALSNVQILSGQLAQFGTMLADIPDTTYSSETANNIAVTSQTYMIFQSSGPSEISIDLNNVELVRYPSTYTDNVPSEIGTVVTAPVTITNELGEILDTDITDYITANPTVSNTFVSLTRGDSTVIYYIKTPTEYLIIDKDIPDASKINDLLDSGTYLRTRVNGVNTWEQLKPATAEEIDAATASKYIDAATFGPYKDSVTAAIAALTTQITGLTHTAITGIDLKPVSGTNKFTVEITWTDGDGVEHVTTDPTEIEVNVASDIEEIDLV